MQLLPSELFAQSMGYFCLQFKKWHTNNHQKDENSPNLVTLIVTWHKKVIGG
jgi:hypothetical protein